MRWSVRPMMVLPRTTLSRPHARDAVQVADSGCPRPGARRASRVELHARIDGLVRRARAADLEAAHGDVLAGHGDHAAGAVAFDERLAAPVEGERPVEQHRAVVTARCEDQHVAGLAPAMASASAPALGRHHPLSAAANTTREEQRDQRETGRIRGRVMAQAPSARPASGRASPCAARGRTTGNSTSRRRAWPRRRWPRRSACGPSSKAMP
jgi:hypothetical protein